MPEYPGGEDSLIKFLSCNINYPQICVDNEITSNVLASFVICEDGSLCQLKTNRSKNQAFDEEVKRILSKMPNWKPGYQKGKAVKVYFELPVNFKLDYESNFKLEELNLSLEEIKLGNFINWADLEMLKMRIGSDEIMQINTLNEYREKIENSAIVTNNTIIYLYDIKYKSESNFFKKDGKEYYIKLKKEVGRKNLK